MRVHRATPHFLHQFQTRAEYPVATEQEALRIWNKASRLPTEPFNIEGRARWWHDADAILIANGQDLVTVLTPTQVVDRCAEDSR